MAAHDWHAIVSAHARGSGARHLPIQTIAELAAHLEDIYLDALSSGYTEAEAFDVARAALAESSLSTVPVPRVRGPEARPWSAAPDYAAGPLPGLAGDLRFAWRQLRRFPSFALIAIGTLGLGAGAATAIFSVVDAVILRPLPYKSPHELVMLWEQNLEKGLPKEHLSPVNFMDYRGVHAAFADAAAWWRPDINVADPGVEPVRVNAIETSGNLFQLLGVSPQLGPGFPANGPFFSREFIAVISDRFWREHYRADPDILGKILSVNQAQYAIAGVMPPGFTFPDDVDIWLRLGWDLSLHSRGAHFMEAVARLNSGVTASQAAAELSRLTTRLDAENPATNASWSVYPTPLLEDMLGYYRPALFVLLGAVSLVLITACLNVASLLLARVTTRAREMAMRAALGASRARLVRQMLVESLLLAAGGTLVGGAGAFILLELAIAWMPLPVPRLQDATLDLRVLAFALGTTGATTLIFGLLPALVISRSEARDALRYGVRSTAGARSRRWNGSLVVAEVALACAVLVASSLLVRSVGRMLHAPIGVTSSNVVVARVQLSGGASYKTWEEVQHFYTTLLDTIRAQPGIEAAGAATALPLDSGWATRLPFTVEGPATPPADAPMAQHVVVSAGYFEAFRVPLKSGRFFSSHDTVSSEPVVLVNETFARRTFPGGVPLGRRINSTAGSIGPLGRNLAGRGPFRIVGVVGDVQHTQLGRALEPVIYHTHTQFPFRPMHLVARGPDPATVATALRTALRQVDASIPLSGVRTMDARVLDAAAAPRLLTWVLTAFAVIMAVLAMVGVYGLLACIVNDRRHEMAIRLALGARPRSLAALVTSQGLTLAAMGVAVGLALAQFTGVLLQGLLFQTRTSDPLAIAVAGSLLLAAAAVACAAPAWRAARVAPLEGLKGE
jgi:putative ABC transport system permease protein